MESMGKEPRRRRSFTPEFKAEIVDLCQRGDRSVGQIARDFDLTETTVREWVKQSERDSGAKTKPPPDKRPSGRSVRHESRTVTSAVTQYTTRLLTPDTWDDFAALVEANNGVWGGCWCIGFHPEGISKDSTAAGNREAKLTHVNNGTIHQMLVYRDGRCVGWCQYGPPAEVATIKNPKAYEKGLAELPDWRIGCLFTGSGSRRKGVARAGVAAALAAIAHAGGGLVEAYPEQVAGRDPQRGAYLHTGPESLFEEFGFVRDRRIAKWRWVMRLRISA